MKPSNFFPAGFSVIFALVVSAATLSSTPILALGAAAYDTLEVGGHYTLNTNRNEYHDFWDAGKGAELYLTTSFHTGNLWFGVRYLNNSSKSPDIPDFRSSFIYTGWSYPLFSPWRLQVEPGVSLGADVFFVEGEKNSGLKYEMEVAGELFVRTSYRLSDNWRLNVAGGSHLMFTHRRIKLSFVSTGISRSLSIPGWMRGFLK
jgi:hypothetical protein